MPIPIIMLHEVKNRSQESANSWCISHDKFSALLDYLYRLNYETITFADIVSKSALRGSSRKKVVLTFDDGYKHLFDFAIPELQKRQMKAAFYIPTSCIGKYNFWDVEKGYEKEEIMNESDLKELDRLGMEVGAHSHHHINLKEAADGRVVAEEISQSKKILEVILNKRVYSFAYPYAAVPKEYKKLLSDEGYYYGLSFYQPYENKFALRRICYHNNDTEQSLRLKLSFPYKILRTLRDPFMDN